MNVGHISAVCVSLQHKTEDCPMSDTKSISLKPRERGSVPRRQTHKSSSDENSKATHSLSRDSGPAAVSKPEDKSRTLSRTGVNETRATHPTAFSVTLPSE